ncbi:MAG: hypothetical protein L6V93_15225 [Clostridiales bacterium]|nr:MAG: hypothetical protein L6V93_15225 [Clostridiales bacterium]
MMTRIFFSAYNRKIQKIAVIPITHHIPAFDEGKLLADLLGEKGFDLQYLKDGIKKTETDGYDLNFCTRSSRARSDRSDFFGFPLNRGAKGCNITANRG